MLERSIENATFRTHFTQKKLDGLFKNGCTISIRDIVLDFGSTNARKMAAIIVTNPQNNHEETNEIRSGDMYIATRKTARQINKRAQKVLTRLAI